MKFWILPDFGKNYETFWTFPGEAIDFPQISKRFWPVLPSNTSNTSQSGHFTHVLWPQDSLFGDLWFFFTISGKKFCFFDSCGRGRSPKNSPKNRETPATVRFRNDARPRPRNLHLRSHARLNAKTPSSTYRNFLTLPNSVPLAPGRVWRSTSAFFYRHMNASHMLSIFSQPNTCHSREKPSSPYQYRAKTAQLPYLIYPAFAYSPNVSAALSAHRQEGNGLELLSTC